MRTEWALPLLALAVSAVSVLALLRWRALPADIPNQRSSHQRPVPRGGGLAIWAGWGAALAVAGSAAPWLVSAAILASVSYVDDRRGLSVAVRLPVHVLAAAAFVLNSITGAAWPVQLGLIVATVWMLNLFNFMDGADGLAGAMAVSGFSTLAIAALAAREVAFGWQLASLAAACLAFLWVNWSPARVFLGDVGSVPLGFLAAAMAIDGWVRGLWAGWFPVLVFLPFIADASFTLIKRGCRGERIWKAHREHAYQKLILMGWSHARVAWLYFGLMVACGLTALGTSWLVPAHGPWALAVWASALLLTYVWVMRLGGTGRRGVRHAP